MNWQPIETAPKDGTLILVLMSEDYTICPEDRFELVRWGTQRSYEDYPFWITNTDYSLSRYWKYDSGKPEQYEIPVMWTQLVLPPST
jgi:hypothetical protein